jgi:O-antigen/teichoic acid export membrane protein
MSIYRKLASHSFHYLIAQIGSIVAGLISMPILARILEREDYGQLSLILITVNFLAAFARLGLPQSVARHLAEYHKQGTPHFTSYISSIFYSSLLVSSGVIVIAALGGIVLQESMWDNWSNYMLLCGVLLCNEVMFSVLTELYRAQERSVFTSALILVVRYISLAGSLLFFFYISKTLHGLLFGKASATVVVLILFTLPLFIRGLVKIRTIDSKVVREGIAYGLPLSIASAAGFFISYGDRYVIQGLLDAVQLARYSLPYDILQQIELAITTPLRMAVIPMIFSVIASEGLSSAADFVSQVVRGVLFIIVPIIVGASVVGYDIVILIGSVKYADSANLMALLAPGILLGGLGFLFTVGLAYQKRTVIIAWMTFLAGVVNILLNLVMVPYFGVYGAGLASVITYLAYLVVSYYLSAKYIKYRFYMGSIVKAVLASLVMGGTIFWVAEYIPDGGLALLFKIPLGIVVYAAILFLIDGEVRAFVRKAVSTRRIIPGSTT